MGSCASGASTLLCENISSIVSRSPEAANNGRTSQQLVPRNTVPIGGVYDFRRKLGSGSGGEVHRVRHRHRQTESPRAVKTIQFSENADFFPEIAALQVMSHPNILKLHETFEETNCVHLVTELCCGKDLCDLIGAEGCLTGELTSVLARQLLEAVSYMHGLGVSHRDLKPENLMLMSRSNPEVNPQGARLKVIDFGLARTFREGDIFRTPAGYGSFMAPEAFSGNHDARIDIWACGVLLFFMHTGSIPWSCGVLEELECGIDFSGIDVAAEFEELVGQLAAVRPADRITAKDALRSSFLA